MLCARIRTTILVILLPFFLSVAADSQVRPTPTPTPDDTVRIETEEIKINVLAYDESNKFVGNVRPEDLVVTENNILHQATSLRRIPANVVIVLDTGGELRQLKTIGQTRKTAEALIAALQPTDAVAIVQYSDRAEIVSGLTTDRTKTAEALGRTNFGLGSEFLEAIRLASEVLTRKDLENRHLVLITDGTDSTATGAARERSLRQLLETDINVHVISYTRLEAAAIEPLTKKTSTKPQLVTEDPIAMPREVAELLPNGTRDFRTSPRVGPTISLDRSKRNTWKRRQLDLETAESQLLSLTENANGMMIVPVTLDEMIEKTPAIAQNIDGSYVLTYMPKIPLSEKRIDRYITVTSKRSDLVVQARRKLVIPKTQ